MYIVLFTIQIVSKQSAKMFVSRRKYRHSPNSVMFHFCFKKVINLVNLYITALE